MLSTPLAAAIDYEQLFWVKEKTIFLPAVVPVTFDYNIVIPLEWWNVNNMEKESNWITITREQAIQRGILTKGQGLEDIDTYIKQMKLLETDPLNYKRIPIKRYSE